LVAQVWPHHGALAGQRESGFGLIAVAVLLLEAAAIQSLAVGRVVGVKVREVLRDWPPLKWASDDPGNAPLRDPGELRLMWFSVPDVDGWFRLTATDSQNASWWTYCRAPAEIAWQALEAALAASLKQPLARAGDVEILERR
jgi:hypothetical protein